jgi:glucose-1-phosphate adenylyltransferase
MSMVDDLARTVTVVVLGGGRGARLDPLTQRRSKPAVPVAAKYRLIDIAISNAINSRMERMYVLTQFNSVSLHRHRRVLPRLRPDPGGAADSDRPDLVPGNG